MTDQVRSLDALYHQLRYFLLAAVIAFLTLVLTSAFALNVAHRNADVPRTNTHIICQALLNAELELPEECTDKVLNDHDH